MRRRELLGCGAAFAASPALAEPSPIPAISDYERASGGRIGVYAQNLKTGRRLSWRADERFVMCSTFKASLAACVLSRVDAGREGLARPIAVSPGAR